ncbi:FadR/GntR family transcriptional regulator [Castellaniella sp.]|uniref:FadR/GntR family transcriptional regulator n=1 Tax=Castellaniella sp. TaxID=1955812 RepID=UPI00355D0B0B
MNQLDTISTVRLYRIIADRIAAKIESGDFPVGERLPAERLLSDQLGVSRASVREALIALELQGYVDVRVGAGVFVRNRAPRPRVVEPLLQQGRQQVEVGPFDLLETRLLLEPEAAARVAVAATREQIEDIEQAQQRMDSGPPYQAHDQAFHLAIARACGNAALESAITHIWQLSADNQVFRRLDEHFVNSQDWDLAILEHRQIVAALRRRSAEQARTAMQAHLANILMRLHRDFDDPASVVGQTEAIPQAGV